MQKSVQVRTPLYAAAYWQQAADEFKNIRVLAFAGMVTALAIILESFPIYLLGQSLKIYFSFVVVSLGCACYGPLVGMGVGAVIDTLGFLLSSYGEPYFPGYLITAMLSGGALAVSGLMLQTAFRNPLADPSIFGISSGAGVGVALALLLFGGTVTVGSYSTTGFVAVVMAAFAGAMAVMAIVFLFSIVVRNNVMLLIIGIMVGYLASSVTSLLNFFATEEGVKSYVVWGMGDFSGVSMRQLPAFATIIIAGMVGAVLLIKPLNLLLLGEGYARNLGVSVVRVRNWLLVITGLLTAVVTACCGPVSFIGLAVPHIARLLIPVSDHRILLPSTVLMGAVVALACNLFCVLPGGGGIIPLNAVTPIIGSPVIIYIIMRNRS